MVIQEFMDLIDLMEPQSSAKPGAPTDRKASDPPQVTPSGLVKTWTAPFFPVVSRILWPSQ